MKTHGRIALGALLLVGIFAASTLPVAGAAPTGISAAAPGTVPVVPVASAPAPSGAAHGVPNFPIGMKLPCMTNPQWPAYAVVGDGFPPTGNVQFQTGCGGLLFAGQDEAHMNYVANAPQAGQRFTVPLHLPSSTLPYTEYGGFYFGFVVSGDNTSEWNESYAELSFIPDATATSAHSYGWAVTVSVYSLVNYTFPDNSPKANLTCPGAGWFSLAWNDSYYCEGNDMNSSGYVDNATVAGGDWFNITVAGQARKTPLAIWANDSTHSSASFEYTLNWTNTGTYNFTPAFSYANESNVLGWGMGEGNGVGVALCPGTSAFVTVCNSYDVYTWTDTPTFETGIPEYWTGSGYSGDYQLLAFESSSGACSYQPGQSTTSVALCIGTTIGGGTGYYPYWSYNGTLSDFGSFYNWSTWNLDGPTIQFNSGGTLTPIVPLYVDEMNDNSRGGYAPYNVAVNVTARAQVVGHLVNASLNYRLPGGGWTSLAMSKDNGTSTIGFYNATIPAGGPNGTVDYFVYSVDKAGVGAASNINTVVRGPLPTFNVLVTTTPKFCGVVVINGTSYSNGQTAKLEPGKYSLSQVGCFPYINPTYHPTLNLLVLQNQTVLEVRGNGQLQLGYTFNPPSLTLLIGSNTKSCSTPIDINNASYSPGNTAILVWNRTYFLSYSKCASYGFAGFTGSADVNVSVALSSITLVMTKNGSLTINFVTSSSDFPILFLVDPGGCGGGVSYAGATYENDSSVYANASVVPITPVPCPLNGFKWFVTGGGASYDNGSLTLTAQGTVTMVQYYLTIITVVTRPPDCGGIMIDGKNYTNGMTDVVGNNSTHTIQGYACPGYYIIGIGATGGLHLSGNVLTANGSGQLQMSLTNQTAEGFVGFETNPQYCGSIGFEGQLFQDTNYTFVPIGTNATLSTVPCNGYGFLRWETYGQISIVNNTATVNGPGSITAVFTRLAFIIVSTSPTGCGAVSIAGTEYVNNQAPNFPLGSNLSVTALPCPGYVFSGWVYSTGLTLYGGNNATVWANVNGASTLDALFVPQSFPVTITVTPSNCGHVSLNRKLAYSGQTIPLPVGNYSLGLSVCHGDQLAAISATGNVSVSNVSAGSATLWVNGSGSVTVLLQPTPPTVTLALPGSSGAGLAVAMTASVAEPLPPFNYTYAWVFGDGNFANTTQGATYHAFLVPGTFTVRVAVTDPLGRIAYANATISVSSSSSGTNIGSFLPALGAIVLAIAVVAVAWWYSGRGGGAAEGAEEPGPSRRPPAEEGPAPMDTAPSTDEPLPKEP